MVVEDSPLQPEIATTREVLPALELITQRALDLLDANHVAIYLLQEDNVTLKTVTAHGIYRNELLSHTRRVGEGISGNIFLNGKPEIVNDTSADPRRVTIPGTPEKENKLESLMSSPLILRGKTIGIINAWNRFTIFGDVPGNYQPSHFVTKPGQAAQVKITEQLLEKE